MRRMIVLGLIMVATQVSAEKLNPKDFQHYLGPQPCAECHNAEAKIWRNTHHSTSFKTMPRSSLGKQIAKTLDIRRIKTSEQCISCHVTQVVKRNRVRPTAGVSCESCHGPAANWNDIHHDYGGKDVKAENESAAHKKQRIERSEQAGMVRPGRYYAMFANCYGCHSVADEKLVNRTKHPGPSDFELLSWVTGEIRHNVFHSKHNRLPTVEKQRVIYVLGQCLNAEFALRGLAQSTVDGAYRQQQRARLTAATQQITRIQSLINAPQLAAILKTLATASNCDSLQSCQQAADAIREQTQQIQPNHDGKAWAALDSLLPKQRKGTPRS